MVLSNSSYFEAEDKDATPRDMMPGNGGTSSQAHNVDKHSIHVLVTGLHLLGDEIEQHAHRATPSPVTAQNCICGQATLTPCLADGESMSYLRLPLQWLSASGWHSKDAFEKYRSPSASRTSTRAAKFVRQHAALDYRGFRTIPYVGQVDHLINTHTLEVEATLRPSGFALHRSCTTISLVLPRT